MEPLDKVIARLCARKFPGYRDPMYEIYIRTGELELPRTLPSKNSRPARLSDEERAKKKARWEEIREYEVWLKSQSAEQIRKLELDAERENEQAIQLAFAAAEVEAEREAEERVAAAAALVDWDFWRAMPQVELWQACALSLAVDPDTMKVEPNGRMAGADPQHGPYFTPTSFPSKAIAEAFEKRLRLAKAHRGDFGQDLIPLPVFAAWALSIPFRDMPPELREIAAGAEVGGGQPADQKPIAESVEDSSKTDICIPATEVPPSSEDQKTALWRLADEVAKEIGGKGAPISLNAVCKELCTARVRGKNPKLLLGQKGWHETSWLKAGGRLKGWIDPAYRK